MFLKKCVNLHIFVHQEMSESSSEQMSLFPSEPVTDYYLKYNLMGCPCIRIMERSDVYANCKVGNIRYDREPT